MHNVPDGLSPLPDGSGGLGNRCPAVGGFAPCTSPGAAPIPLRDQFATWLGWLIRDGAPLGFVLVVGQDLAEAASPIAVGMLIQAVGLADVFLLGTGTALVYPSLLAAVSDATHPSWRAGALGIYRFWRDAGYAIGALIGGITAALASLDAAILVATILTAASGLLAWAVMDETHPAPDAGQGPPS